MPEEEQPASSQFASAPTSNGANADQEAPETDAQHSDAPSHQPSGEGEAREATAVQGAKQKMKKKGRIEGERTTRKGQGRGFSRKAEPHEVSEGTPESSGGATVGDEALETLKGEHELELSGVRKEMESLRQQLQQAAAV